MSVVSANTLFHFTKSQDGLLGILETGFRPSYCCEFGNATGGRILESHIPMVCFCDLPLSSIEKHSLGYKWEFDNKEQEFLGYGKFALGMSKEWAQKAMLNPVTYITNESYYLNSALALNHISIDVADNKDAWMLMSEPGIGEKKDSTSREERMKATLFLWEGAGYMKEMAHSLFSYFKPYQSLETGQRFYDEREWRFVVPFNFMSGYQMPVIMPSMHKEEFETKKKEAQEKLNADTDHRLTFEAKDVKYIILESEADVKPVFDKLRSLPDKYKEEDIEKLVSRIVTMQQIKEDF